MEEPKPKLIDKEQFNFDEHPLAIVLLTNGMAYVKDLPPYGIYEVEVRNGKIIGGNNHDNWKLN